MELGLHVALFFGKFKSNNLEIQKKTERNILM
jgi:hypothetical protein